MTICFFQPVKIYKPDRLQLVDSVIFWALYSALPAERINEHAMEILLVLIFENW